MPFELKNQDAVRIGYDPGTTPTYKFPRGNLFAGMNLLLKVEIDIATNNSAGVPSFQIGRAIQKLEIKRGSTAVWSISGEMLELMCKYRFGNAAKKNATLTVNTGTNKIGYLYLPIRFSPDNALKPWEYAMDTRAHEYTLAITWRDLTAAGTLFGTNAGTVSATKAENYVDIELVTLGLRGNDRLASVRPFFRGLIESTHEVTSNNPKYKIETPQDGTFRSVTLVTMEEDSDGADVVNGSVFDDKIILTDNQFKEYHAQRAEFIHQATALRWGLGSNLPDGVFDVHFLEWGSVLDALASDNIHSLKFLASVVKQTGDTTIRSIFDTVEQQ